ncbi:hypothetical protein [Macrococcus sp. DPC7161]|uniref:hypothetical protein n=1 Tax=Macrococcus sp. DPC7161 TaxID=2507060 RepID=UPI00100A9B53|nr:hypothetical protein [Macrococcus sp. DPC7161]RXK19096.1 hypothetical protein ER639_01925 [Macrococcus sp. DPC7161]
MARFGKKSIDEVNQMTLTEFYCLCHAKNESDLYDEYKMHKMAYLQREVEAQKEKGAGKNKRYEYVYKSFKDFFDYEKAERDLKEFEEEITENKVTRKNVTEMLAKRNKKD